MKLKDMVKAGGVAAASHLPDALMLVGAAACAYGAGLVYRPAGFLVAGLFMLVAGWLLARGGR